MSRIWLVVRSMMPQKMAACSAISTQAKVMPIMIAQYLLRSPVSILSAIQYMSPACLALGSRSGCRAAARLGLSIGATLRHVDGVFVIAAAAEIDRSLRAKWRTAPGSLNFQRRPDRSAADRGVSSAAAAVRTADVTQHDVGRVLVGTIDASSLHATHLCACRTAVMISFELTRASDAGRQRGVWVQAFHLSPGAIEQKETYCDRQRGAIETE
jgi:hypothetical protein